MTDNNLCKRIAAWLFATALTTTFLGVTIPALHAARPSYAQTVPTAAYKPTPAPKAQIASIAAVVATPTPTPTPEPTVLPTPEPTPVPTAVPTAVYTPPAPTVVYAAPAACEQVSTAVVRDEILRVFGTELAVAVFTAESSLNNCIVNSIHCCVGIAQINLSAHYANIPGATYAEKLAWLQDYRNNIAYAHTMYVSQGWGPWEAYTNGLYKKFL